VRQYTPTVGNATAWCIVFDGEMGIPKGWPQDELVVKALLSHAWSSFRWQQMPWWRTSRWKAQIGKSDHGTMLRN